MGDGACRTLIYSIHSAPAHDRGGSQRILSVLGSAKRESSIRGMHSMVAHKFFQIFTRFQTEKMSGIYEAERKSLANASLLHVAFIPGPLCT
jgi:hypothetical protein